VKYLNKNKPKHMKKVFAVVVLFVAVIALCSFLDRTPASEKKYSLTDSDINTIYISVNECRNITPNQRDSVFAHIIPAYQQYKQAELKDSTKK
jgi:hypothetical protein